MEFAGVCNPSLANLMLLSNSNACWKAACLPCLWDYNWELKLSREAKAVEQRTFPITFVGHCLSNTVLADFSAGKL